MVEVKSEYVQKAVDELLYLNLEQYFILSKKVDPCGVYAQEFELAPHVEEPLVKVQYKLLVSTSY